MSKELRERMDSLETAFAHHEVLVGDLSDELAKQWQVIERMRRRIQELEEKIDSLGDAAVEASASEPPPPHY